MQSYGQLAGVAPRVGRIPRHPQHPFHIKHAPYEIAPFMIAPVLPGETLQNLALQSRALTQPLKSSLIGWWLEHYFFYVKWRDMDDSDLMQAMVIDPTQNLTTHDDYQTGTRDTYYYWSATSGTTGTGINWLKACMRKIIENYFRDEGEAWDVCTIDSHPAAYLNLSNVFHSFTLDTEMAALDDNITIPVDAAPTPDVVNAGDVAKALWQYEYLRQAGLTEATYEDWLRSFGVRVQLEDANIPELIRYSRAWTYPSSHVIPDTVTAGNSTVTSACSWVITERADKKRLFLEPGFIIGCSVARPKVYMSKQNRFAASLMADAYTWLPAVLRHDTKASWTKVTDAATDILAGTATGDYWVDIKDLLVHGDQFCNFDIVAEAGSCNAMAVPTTAGNTKYPVQASVDALFVSADATNGIRQDGLVRAHIMGAQADTSPRGSIV